jgi:hypothetical protein
MRSLFRMVSGFIRKEWFLLVVVSVIALIIYLFELL